MKEFLRHHAQTVLILIGWTIVGILIPKLTLIVIPLTVVFLKLRHRYKEIFFGFIYLTMLTDLRIPMFFFSKDIKELYFLIMAVFMLFDRKLFAPFSNFIYPYIAFFLIAFYCSLYYPESPFISLEKLFSYFLLYLVIPNYVTKLYRDDPRNFILFFVYFIIFLLSLSLVLYLPLRDTLSIGGRYSGVLGNPNALGLFCLIFCIVLFVINDLEPDLFTTGQKRLFFAILIANILLCRSRTALIAITMFLIFAASFKNSTFFGLLVVILVFITNAYIVELVQEFSSILGLNEFLRIKDIEKGSGRLVAWSHAWKNINQDTFFIGNGFNYTNYIFDLYLEKLSLLGHQGNAHNTYLTFWLDTGLVGLLLFLNGFVRSFTKLSTETRYAFPALFALGFTMFFESWYCAAMNPYIFQVILIIVISKLPRINEVEKVNAEKRVFGEG